MKRLSRVIDLSVGDKIKCEETVVIVRKKLNNRIWVSKETAQGMYGIFSIPYYHHNFADLCNRVELI